MVLIPVRTMSEKNGHTHRTTQNFQVAKNYGIGREREYNARVEARTSYNCFDFTHTH